MIRIQIFKKMSESLKKKGIRSQGPFPFLNNKMEHPRIKKESRKKQEKGNHEPLVSLKRPGSAEQAQFFSVFRSNGGKQEATVRCESRLRGGVGKKTPVPRRTGAIYCVFPTNRGQ